MKNCIICGISKDLSEYYAHPSMKDGHLNKCKSCCKEQSNKRQHLLFADNEWREKERIRAIEKYNRLNYKERQVDLNKIRYWKNNSVYKNLHKKARLSKNEAIHHWNYNFIKDFIVLNKDIHRYIHRFLMFDETSLCFFDENNILLDTKDKHMEYVNTLIKRKTDIDKDGHL